MSLKNDLFLLHREFARVYSKDSKAPQSTKSNYRRVNRKLQHLLNKYE